MEDAAASYRFDEFEVDVKTPDVRCGDRSTQLGVGEHAVLLELVQHPKEVVKWARIDEVCGWQAENVKLNSDRRDKKIERLRDEIRNLAGPDWKPLNGKSSDAGRHLIRTVKTSGIYLHCRTVAVAEARPPVVAVAAAVAPTAEPLGERAPALTIVLGVVALSVSWAFGLERSSNAWTRALLFVGPPAIGLAIDYLFLRGFKPAIQGYLRWLDGQIGRTTLGTLPRRVARWTISFMGRVQARRLRGKRWIVWCASSVALTTLGAWIAVERARSFKPYAGSFLDYLSENLSLAPLVYVTLIVFDYAAIVITLRVLKKIARARDPVTPLGLIAVNLLASFGLAIAALFVAVFALRVFDSGMGDLVAGDWWSMFNDGLTILIGVGSPTSIGSQISESFVVEWLMVCVGTLSFFVPIGALLGVLGCVFLLKYSLVGFVRSASDDPAVLIGFRCGLTTSVLGLIIFGAARAAMSLIGSLA